MVGDDRDVIMNEALSNEDGPAFGLILAGGWRAAWAVATKL